MISDREVTFFLALGELLADIEQPKRLIEKKLDAFRKARGLTEEYVRRGIREDLVGVILKKKLALILIAKTADEVERAANPHRPQYDFGTWREDPFALPEEELAIWGIVSPYNMLRPEAQDRYMDLFTRVFHITREQLISKAITQSPNTILRTSTMRAGYRWRLQKALTNRTPSITGFLRNWSDG